MKTPEGWAAGTLGKSSVTVMGTSPPSDSYNSHGAGLPLLNGPSEFGQRYPTPIQWTTRVTRICEPGDVLFCVRGSTTGRQNVADQAYCIGRGIAAVRGDEERTETGYLRYVMQEVAAEVLRQARGAGSTFPSITRKSLEAWPILLPPLPEQRKIATILSSVDATIEKTEAVVEQLQGVKKAMMQELLTRGLPGRHRRFKKTEIGEVPAEWDVVALASECIQIVVGIVVKPASYYVVDGIPALRSKNIREDRLDLEDLVFISPRSNEKLSKSRLRTGDVLTVRTGYPGTSCVVPQELAGANCVDLIISRPGPRLRGAFLSRYVNSERGMATVTEKQGGLAQQHFNVGAMKRMPVPIPSSIEEQDAIVEQLIAIDNRIVAERQTANALAQLKSSLMFVLLSGEVRVTPDENIS